MSEILKKSTPNGLQKTSVIEDQQAKINEVRRSVGQLPERLAIFCSDATISRYLRARNWNVKKATKMLKETLKWRAKYKPEEIRWEEIAHEAETGKIYRSNYMDKHGRTVLVMRPSCQNTKSTKGQIRYLVYCMENAVLNLPPHQEQMVWLIDFHGYNLSNVSLKVTRETAHILQDHYPERLGLAILYNAPKFFEPFWSAAKAFLDPKTFNKVKFVYSDEPSTMKIMEDLFDMDELEGAFGGRNSSGFDISKYAERMREDDKRMPSVWAKESTSEPQQDMASAASLDSLNLDSDSDGADDNQTESPKHHQKDSEAVSKNDQIGAADSDSNASKGEASIEVVSREQNTSA